MFQAPRGTQDILPREQPYWHYVERVAEKITRLYGYERIETPVFEESGLFIRSVGTGTDIVEKEMYTFTDLGGGEMTLRPEGTASVCRAYIEHGMASLPQPIKLYYLAPIFRYERPQAGRFREHHQFGCEAIGDEGAVVDAEVIDMAWLFFETLGLKGLRLQINSIGCTQCRPAYLTALKTYFQALPLCPDCQVRLKKNALRLLDCKNSSCMAQIQNAPRSIDHLCSACAAHFTNLQGHLEQLGLPFNIDTGLVRGLDYYTRTVFEIQPELEGAQSTLGGGGRYDGLIEELGGKPTPGVGFATGIERIILNLKRQNVAMPAPPRPGVFIAWVGERAQNEFLRLAAILRRAGVDAAATYSSRSLKAQLRLANTLGCSYTVIIGEEELTRGTLSLRNMQVASQEEITPDALIARLGQV
ncbi:MAG: histidine--tRNA ligase [Dehalococcoidia bacterium]|nr:histidine--tRNA ligase [Dehalococcoidia bacterium]